MNIRFPLIVGLCATALGCGRGKITLGDIQSADDVEEACEKYDGDIVIEMVSITFPETDEECPWGEDDNGWEKVSRITARVEQYEELAVDSTKLLCDMQLDLATVERDEEQIIYYDDFFFFTFNDVVLASDNEPAVLDLPVEDEMPIYEWDAILNRRFDDNDQSFCLGEDAGLAECEIPVSQEEAPISLSYESPVIDRLSARAVSEGRFEFGFITTGDDNPEKDCHHTEFTFTVEVETLDLGE